MSVHGKHINRHMNSMRLVLHKRVFTKIRAAEQQHRIVDRWSKKGRESDR